MTTETQFNNIVNIMTKYQNNSIRIYNDDKITEENIMSALFSNTLMIDENAKKYFLKYQYTDVYENILQKTKFYGLNFNSIQPDSTKKNIYDIDVSYYNKQDVMKYYVLLDLLSELYGSLSAKGLLSKTITIKSRYVIEDNQIVLYKKSDYYTFDIHYNYDSISGISKYAIINVQNKDMTNMVINMYEIYKNDILKHLNYINKNDITYSTKEYLYNIQSFYKFCRLKLIYYTLACSAKINKKVDDFILQYLSFSFLNLKSSIVLKNIDNKSLDLSNQFLLTSDKLDKLNQKIYKSQNKIKKNYNIQKQLNNSFIKYIFWIIVIIAVIMTIGTYILYHSKSFNPRGIVDILIITIIIIIYVICHYIMKINIKEKFEILSKLPNPSATSNDYNTIKIVGSSKQSGTDYWHAFDNNNKTSWNTAINTYSDGKASTTFKSDYKGEFIMIDLGNAYTLNKYGINFKDINKGPGKFRLYVSNSANSWNNLNDSGWKMIHDVSSVSNDYTQVKEEINIDSSTYQKENLLSNNYNNTVSQNYSNKNYIRQTINCSESHSLYLLNDGKVLGEGQNNYGQLGTGNTNSASYPVYALDSQGVALTNIIEVCAGNLCSFFLKNDGTVLSCGHNYHGVLGNDTGTTYIPTPVLSSPGVILKDIVQISVSKHIEPFLLLLNKDGYALGCGQSKSRALGASGNQSNYPMYIKINSSITITNIIQVSAGIGHSLFLQKDGKVIGLGDGPITSSGIYYGVIGYGVTNYITNDKGIPITDIIQVSAGSHHSLFLKKDGTALSIGYNFHGTLGNGNPGNLYTNEDIHLNPSNVLNEQRGVLTNIEQVIAGYHLSLFLMNDGTVRGCGGGLAYILTDFKVNKYITTNILNIQGSSLKDVVQISFGGISGGPLNNLLFLQKDGKVLKMSDWYQKKYILKSAGIELTNVATNIKKIPIETNLDSSIYQKEYLLSNNYNKNYIRKSISRSRSHLLYLQNDGKVLGSGTNSYGELGTGQYSIYYPSYALNSQGATLTNIIEVSAGYYNSYFLKNDGTVLSCGYNGYGQLGNGTTNTSYYMVYVLSSPGVVLKDIVQISANSNTYYGFLLLLKKNGTVLSCGYNGYGQLGTGNKTFTNYPVYVLSSQDIVLKDIVQISAGAYNSLFLQNNGKVLGCGYNEYGQLGNGTTNTTYYYPKYVLNSQGIAITDIIQVSAGHLHSLFLQKDGKALGCGGNSYGELGTGNRKTTNYPVYVLNSQGIALTNIVQVITGTVLSLFLMNDSTVLACGIIKNYFNTYPIYITNAQGVALKDVIQISCAGNSTDYDYYTSSMLDYNYNYNNDILFLQKDGKVLYTTNYDINNQKYVPKSDGTALTNVATNINTPDIQTISKDVVDRNNNYGYRYCAFVINELTGSDSSLQITNLDIYGVEKVIPPEPVIQSPTIQSPAIVTTSAEYEQVLKELENAIKRAQQKELDADAEAVKKANIETLNATEIKKLEDKIAELNKQISDQAISTIDKQIKQREADILNKNIAISKAQQEINKTNTEKALYDAEQAKLEVIKAQITQLEAQLRINVNKMGNLSGNYDNLVLQLNALKDNDNILKNESNKLQSIIQKQVSAEATLNAEKTKEISDKLLALKEKYINQSLASYLTELTSLAEIAKKNTQDAIDKKKQLTESTKNTSNIYLNLQDEEIKRLMLIQKKAEQLVVTERIEKMAKAEQNILDIRKQHYEDLSRMLKKMEKEQDTNLKILEATPYENTSLNRQITRITTDTSNVLKEEQKKYDELVNTQTQQINTLSNDINILRKTLLTIKDEIDAHIQNTISYRASTKRTEEEVKKLSIEMLKKRIELQKYKYTSNVLNIETSVSDINTKITLHINNTATYIANSIILSSLHKEYLDYSDEKDKIQAAEYSSTIDLEIQKRNNQIMIATIYLILNMLIATVIIFIIYGRRSLPYMSYILMLIYIPFIIFYIIEIVKIVHTRASHKYWRKPEQNFV